MSCDHQLLTTHISALLDASLPPTLRARCEGAMQECTHCRDLYEQALQYHELAQQWQDEPVPAWTRTRHLVQAPRRSGSAWLSWGALGASALSLLLTVSHAQISTQGGFAIRFGGNSEAQVQQIVANSLAISAANQAALLDARLDQFAADQQLASQRLYTSLQENNRLERRQELGLLLTSWQNQRYQDQQAITNRFSQLTNDQFENNRYLNTLMKTAALPGRNGL